MCGGDKRYGQSALIKAGTINTLADTLRARQEVRAWY
jgi:hypothetical protein